MTTPSRLTITRMQRAIDRVMFDLRDLAEAWEDYEMETGKQPVGVEDYANVFSQNLEDCAASISNWQVK